MATLSAEQIPDPEKLAEAVFAGDRRALARAVTLVESSRKDHQDLAVLKEFVEVDFHGGDALGVRGGRGFEYECLVV